MSDTKTIFDCKKTTKNVTDTFDKHRNSFHTAVDYTTVHPVINIACKIGGDIFISLLKMTLNEMEEDSHLKQTKVRSKQAKLNRKKGM